MNKRYTIFIVISLFIPVFAICILGFFIYKEFSNNEDTSAARYSHFQELTDKPIVFMSKFHNENGELYLYEDGEITRLTDNNRHENNPALSPEGNKIAFHAGDLDNPLTWEIYILDINTKEETRLTSNNLIDGHPDWSPDGTKIVYAKFTNSSNQPTATADLFIYDLNSGVISQMTDNDWEDNDPEWSPDGTKIVFKSTRNTQKAGREEIFIMNANGTETKQLTTTSGWESDHDPSWSPDSKSIVFSRFEGERIWMDIANNEILQNEWEELLPWNVFEVDLEGNEKMLTSYTDAAAGLPVFSSDINYVSFMYLDPVTNSSRMFGADHELYIIEKNSLELKKFFSDKDHSPTLEYWDW